MTLTTAALLTLPLTQPALAQDAVSPAGATATPAAAEPYIAVVQGNTVNLRSGPSAQSAYAFGKLKAGDAVQVIKEEFGWAKVRTSGPAFSALYAYVPADRRVTLGSNGTAQVTAKTDLRAPNVDAGGAPEKSWKLIGTVAPGTTLTVLGTIAGDNESVYKVALPPCGEGWVNMQFLRRASAAEAATYTETPVNAAPAGSAAPSSVGSAPTLQPAPTMAPAGDATTPGTVTTAASDTQTTPGSPAIPPLLDDHSGRAVPAGTKLSSDGEGAIEVAPRSQRAAVAKQSARASWADLEAQWEAVRQQPQAGAEVEALRGRYMELSRTAPANSALALMATARAEQLELISETQKQSQQLAAIKGQMTERQRAMIQIITDIQRRAEYTTVGVLNASVVYDGKRLPQLYRITDPQTSQTLAYVLPNENIPMGTMLGTLVGVKGGKEFDSALNLTVISPQVVELLTVRETPQVTAVEVKTDAAKPAEAVAEQVPAQTTTP